MFNKPLNVLLDLFDVREEVCAYVGDKQIAHGIYVLRAHADNHGMLYEAARKCRYFPFKYAYEIT